ncbi:TadE family type IV pilus minor pilin [Knoellia subterranea]|uniref:Pilus biosynthesis protein TadE n=1 Tax=Knoellia subterranea KCTC 19937 TaxID=1385521 RepID=A0A0A0JR99_9MICO|nr:TadE family type IV pilus minor pilin [Knoellia subterranea]KGN38101.1 pilus biosynthesis protein TadE [Knoellia subterranea KCTC 19937]
MTLGRHREAGMVTAELAVAVPALVLVLALGLGAVAVVTDHLRCIDAARVGARLLARGEEAGRVRAEVIRQAPPGAVVLFDVGPESVTVEVTSDPPALLRTLGVSGGPRGVAHAVPEAAP